MTHISAVHTKNQMQEKWKVSSLSQVNDKQEEVCSLLTLTSSCLRGGMEQYRIPSGLLQAIPREKESLESKHVIRDNA